MTQQEFHEIFEAESERLFNELNSLSEDQLLKIIADENEAKFKVRKGDDNFQIWRVLQIKGTEKSIKPLFEIVANLENEYLVRYHAGNALFKIANILDDNFKGEVQYGINSAREKIDQQNAINKLGGILNLKTPENKKSKKSWWKIW